MKDLLKLMVFVLFLLPFLLLPFLGLAYSFELWDGFPTITHGLAYISSSFMLGLISYENLKLV